MAIAARCHPSDAGAHAAAQHECLEAPWSLSALVTHPRTMSLGPKAWIPAEQDEHKVYTVRPGVSYCISLSFPAPLHNEIIFLSFNED